MNAMPTLGRRVALVIVAAILLASRVWPGKASAPPAVSAAPVAPASAPAPAPTISAARSELGFRDRAHLEEHFHKHGAEFHAASADDYLRLAQQLRDAPVGGSIEQETRPDGTICRFDRTSGAFLAVDADGVIRTFFRPNDGEAYFRRQLDREPTRP